MKPIAFKPIVRKLSLGVLWLGFLFVLLQGAGYILFNYTGIKSIGQFGYPIGMFERHPSLDYLFRPGFEGYFSGAAYQHIHFKINDHGFRDAPFAPKAGQRTRVVVLGDSVIFGSGVWKAERFTEQLAQHPYARQRNWEVLNLGVNSYSFGHYLAIAREDFFGLAPDMVVVGFTLNDLREMEDAWPARRFRAKSRRDKGKPAWVQRIQKALGRTYAGRFVREAHDRVKYTVMAQDKKEAYHTKWMRVVNANWRKPQKRARLRERIGQFKQIMIQKKTPFIFLILPERNDVLEPQKFGGARTAIVAMLTDLNIDYCNAHSRFVQHSDLQSLYLPSDSIHFTPAGYTLLSETFVDCLQVLHD